jgi:hypothetical protein
MVRWCVVFGLRCAEISIETAGEEIEKYTENV